MEQEDAGVLLHEDVYPLPHFIEIRRIKGTAFRAVPQGQRAQRFCGIEFVNDNYRRIREVFSDF